MIGHLRQTLAQAGTVTFVVRAHPGAKRTMIKSIMDDGSIKIDLKAAPEDGKANELLIEFLAETFLVPRSHIEILSGNTSRHKSVKITL